MNYKRWVTNCHSDDALAYLMKYTNENPDKTFAIDRPHSTIDMMYKTFLELRNRPRGFTTEQLEKADYRGIYECF